MKSRFMFLVAAGACSITLTAAADWPQWRGPDRNGISKETGLLQEWPKEGPRLLWQVKDVGDAIDALGGSLLVRGDRRRVERVGQLVQLDEGLVLLLERREGIAGVAGAAEEGSAAARRRPRRAHRR